MNRAPPLDLTLLSVKLDLLIVTLEPVRQIEPPLEVEFFPSAGLYPLIPLFPTQDILNIVPLLPSQYTAAPSSFAIFLVKLELVILQ